MDAACSLACIPQREKHQSRSAGKCRRVGKKGKKSEVREKGVKKKKKRSEREKERKTWREARQPLANRSAAVIKFAETLNGSELLDGPESGQLTSQPSARVGGGGGGSDWAPEAPPSREII